MPYVSDLINRKVRDSSRAVVGKLHDVAVNPGEEFPTVLGVVVRTGSGDRFVPQAAVQELSRRDITITELGTLADPPEGALLLRREVLDKQIIDAAGARVVRVNDLYMANVEGVSRLSAVDSSFRGFLRRLGLSGRRSPRITRDVQLLAWSDVEFIPSGERASVRLKSVSTGLSKLKPAEIAAIVRQLDARAGARTLEQLDDAVIAETMESIEEEDQADLLEQMSPERAADVLEEMPPEEAADALAAIEDERAEEILAQMDPEAAEDVRELLAYEGDTAGGLMSPNFTFVNVTDTVNDALIELRSKRPDREEIYYVYVLDDEEHLVGILSLRDLVVNEPETPVAELMETGVAHVRTTDEEETVRDLMLRESLLILPVIDDENKMVGVVSVTDAVEHVVAQSWQHRLRRMLG